MLRSILSVIAGSVTWMVTALGTDFLLMTLGPQWFHENGRVENVPLLFFILSYALAYSVLGGYVTAWIAGRKEILHALALGVIQLAMGIVATISHSDAAPIWYHALFLVLLIPANVLGGYLRANRSRRNAHRQLRTA